jgi:EndoU nuclease-like protein
VYAAEVALRDPATGRWVEKLEPSSFFPDALRDPEVIRAILTAFQAGHLRPDGRFVGPSGRGFRVEGWYERGRIEAAYPLRRR